MKRGQAAMEFLMTYGWAVLVLLVMIGALAYFGVLNPSKFFPDKCLMGAGMGCKDYKISDTGGGAMQLAYTIENKEGDGINVQASGTSASTVGGSTVATAPCTPAPTSADVDGTISFTCNFNSGSPGVGKSQKIAVNINYTTTRGVYSHVVSGEIQAKVQ